MQDALHKARAAAQKVARSNAGQYLENDALIRGQLVFDIIDVVFDEGGGFGGGNRWQLRVEPHFEEDSEPLGTITLPDNNARNEFMKSLQVSLDEAEKTEEDPRNVFIGPAVLVSLKANKTRYYEIVPWDTTANGGRGAPIYPEGAQLVSATPEPEPEPSVRTRPLRPSAKPAAVQEDDGRPAATEPARTFEEAVEAKAGSSTALVIEPEPAPEPTEFPAFKEWAKSKNYTLKRGRPPKNMTDEYEAEKAAFEGGGMPASLGPDKAKPVAIPRQHQYSPPPEPVVTAPSRAEIPPAARQGTYVPEGGAYTAQEVSWHVGMSGTSVEPCPACGQYIHDKAFPDPERNRYVLVHTRCQAGGEQIPMEVRLDTE